LGAVLSQRYPSLPAHILIVALGGADSERIAEPLIARGHQVTKVTGLAGAGRGLAEAELVIVDAKATAAAVDGCRRLRKSAPTGLPIMAVAQSHDIEERIGLLEAGADDVLGEPFDARQLEALAEALLSRRQPMPADAGDGGAGMPRPAGGMGRVICFGAAKGGVGTTLLAVNTAVALAQRGLSVAIADLDFHHGQVAAHLDLRATRSTAHLARDTHLFDNPHGLTEFAVTHASGALVYGAPLRPDEGSLISVDDVIEFVRALRTVHPLTIIDAGSVPGSRALALLGLADQAMVVVTPEIPGLRALSGALTVMNESGMAGEQNVFVMNRPFAGGQISRADIEQNLGVKVALEIPFDGEGCLRSVNEGQPLVTLAPRSPVAAAVGRLASVIVDGATVGDNAEAPRRRRLGGLLRRG
jgi:pilus assembly protein CpaE